MLWGSEVQGHLAVGRGGSDKASATAWPSVLFWSLCGLSGRLAGRCRAAQLATIRQMSRQGSRGSPREYQADEQAGVTRLRWRVSGR